MSDELEQALGDIDAYLETMPTKTDDWSIGDTSTPFVKSLRALRDMYDVRMLTLEEAAVARIAAVRLAQDVERLGHDDPDMYKALGTLRVKLARFPLPGVSLNKGATND